MQQSRINPAVIRPTRVTMWLARTAVLVATILGLTSYSTGANAQLPKPMKESEIKAAGGRQVSGPELKQMWTGNTVYIILLKNLGRGKTGAVIVNYYPNDRLRRQKFPDLKNPVDSNWWIDGNNRCVEEKTITAGHLCSTAWELAGTFFVCLQPDGDCGMSFRTVPGNPEGL
jgi:hypothetical protein